MRGDKTSERQSNSNSYEAAGRSIDTVPLWRFGGLFVRLGGTRLSVRACAIQVDFLSLTKRQRGREDELPELRWQEVEPCSTQQHGLGEGVMGGQEVVVADWRPQR